MVILAAATMVGMIVNILYVAIGLGLVIFFHELGHFAVAKWCNVNVERFSIGFGPVLFSRKFGETEYALSLIPFGGYVKMLGQDDMDPSQLSSEEIAEDPRSYSAKTVLQRMAIISAGVIMNVITAVLFFAVAFGMGVEAPPATVGTVQVGMPAWQAGIENGDVIVSINGRAVSSFTDIMRGVALSSGPVEVTVQKPDGTVMKKTIMPDRRGTRRILGVSPSFGLNFAELEDPTIAPVDPGGPAAGVKPPFQPGDRIRRVGDTEVTSYAQLQDILARRRSEPLEFHVQRKGSEELTKVTVPPNPFRTLGLWMDIGKIAAIKEDSPAAVAGLKIGDKITHIDVQGEIDFPLEKEGELAVGNDINPMALPDLLAAAGKAGVDVGITVKRAVEGSEARVIQVDMKPLDKPGWIERPIDQNIPLSVPAAGFAYHFIPKVLHVIPDSPADEAGIKVGEFLTRITLTRPDDTPRDRYADKSIEVKLEKDEEGHEINNWAYATWLLQATPTRKVTLEVRDQGKTRTVEVGRADEKEQFLPTRGIWLAGDTIMLESDSLGGALQLGLTHTRNSITDIYLTLRNLFGGRLSVKELHGPVGIATVAYRVAEQGISSLLLFLGFLSVNLAVLNFLPIPVLDGGHMVFLIWEGVTRRKPSERVMAAATYFGMAFVLGLMILVLYLDLFVHRGKI